MNGNGVGGPRSTMVLAFTAIRGISMFMFRTASLLALTVGAAGCIAVEGDDATVTDDDELGEVEQAAGQQTCPKWVCGANDPLLSVYFHELSELGFENDEGLKIIGMQVGPLLYKVDVTNGELRGKRPGFADIAGPALQNKIIKVAGGGKTFLLKIEDPPSMTPLYPPGSGNTYAYRITYTVLGEGDHAKPLCSAPWDYTGEQDTLFQNKWTVLLFEGDRYDAKLKRIKGYSSDWFSVACAGHALSKLDLTHHTSVTSGGAYVTSIAERDTELGMYTANYCPGTGISFTVGGQELGWKDDKGWFAYWYPIPNLTLEARWNAQGAVCVEEPRLNGTVNPLALQLFPAGVDAAMTAKCGTRKPKKCSDLGQSTDVEKAEGFHLVSANPL